MTSLGGLCKRNEGNLQKKRGRKKAWQAYLLNYSFAPDETFRFVLSIHKSIGKKTLLHSQELWGCSASHLPKRLHIFINESREASIIIVQIYLFVNICCVISSPVPDMIEMMTLLFYRLSSAELELFTL